MSKKIERKSRASVPLFPERGEPTQVNKNIAGGGAIKRRFLWLLASVFIVSGYALLHKVDPGGQNGWAILSPALLLCGYLLIIPAIAYTYPR